MTDTILVWLDGPYSYTHFGICSALSKIGKFDFIGIVTKKQDVSFFNKQTIVNFKKLFYYPDCYTNKSSYNNSILEEFEKKYDLNLWLDILSERYFHKYRTDFHTFSKNEILPIVEHSLNFFINVLQEFNPKLILMQAAGENISNLLLYRLAKKLQIKILMTNIVHIHNKITLSNNLISREISDEFQKLLSNPDSLINKHDSNIIKNQSLAETIKVQSSYIFDTSTPSQKIKHFINRLNHDPELIYQNIGKTKLKMLKGRYYTHFKTKKREEYLNQNLSKSISDEKFLYFPLHTEPEAKILATAPFFTDQISLIENISRSLPIDFSLYVKEHPGQQFKGWRSIQDYKRIIDIPNVKLFHPSINSQELISKSQGVIAISGSTAFETLFFKKPVFLFAEEYFDVVSMVKKIDDISKLPQIIKESIDNFEFKNNELDIILQATENVSITIPYFSILKDGIILSSIQRNNPDATLKHFYNFYDNYNLDFKLLAKIINKKI